jgi:hypothetical protein
MPFARAMRRRLAPPLVCLLAFAATPVRADDLADFKVAVEQAATDYRAAMTTLQSRGREETAAAVHRLRAAWQDLTDRYAARPPAALAGDDRMPGLLMQVDMRLVSALIVIDIGSREAAREALAPIEATLAQLNERTAPEAR